MTEPQFPLGSLAEAQEHLRRPFSPVAIKWKLQTSWPKEGDKSGGIVVPYIDARLVIDRLDTVVGPLWSDRYEIVPGTKALICELTIDGVTRADIGEHNHSTKATCSDALKRAAVRFGVGLSIYSMKRVILNVSKDGSEDSNGRPTLLQKGKKVELTPRVESWLREKYGAWLSNGAGGQFGEPLGGNEDPEAIGLDEHEQSVPVEGEQTSLESAAQVAELQELYESVAPPKSAARKKLSAAKFKAQLRAATGSPEKLAGLRKTVEGLK